MWKRWSDADELRYDVNVVLELVETMELNVLVVCHLFCKIEFSREEHVREE